MNANKLQLTNLIRLKIICMTPREVFETQCGVKHLDNGHRGNCSLIDGQ